MEQWPQTENQAPSLDVSVEVDGLTASFTANAEDDGEILQYQWFFGDLTYESGEALSHIYPKQGSYEAICYVTDKTGNTSWKSVPVTCTNPVTATVAGISTEVMPEGKDISTEASPANIDTRDKMTHLYLIFILIAFMLAAGVLIYKLLLCKKDKEKVT